MPAFKAGLYFAAACSVLFAQTSSTEILGTVTDPTGRVVPGARVSIVRATTGEKREAVTTASGDYSFSFIEIGEYTVTVEKEGFQTQETKGVMAPLQQKVRVDLTLSVGLRA